MQPESPASDDPVLVLRQRVMDATPEEQPHFRAAFADDFVLWCNSTCWTYRVKETGADGRERPAMHPHVPFTLWRRQVEASLEVIDCIRDGRDLVIKKSRDMGASWLVCAIGVWGWLYHRWNPLLVSRIEDLVDKSGDPDSLFWKVDYLIASQPEWNLPAPSRLLVKGGDFRQHLLLRNPATGATISGMASTPHIGRGGRRTFAFFDEQAAMADAEAAWFSAADCTSCRIGNSTPVDAGTFYSKLVSRARTTGEPRLVELMYFDHPEKNAGRETREDKDGSITGFAGAVYEWTDWLAVQVKKRDRIDLAMNVFAESIGSGSAFFAGALVTSYRNRIARPPVGRFEFMRGSLVASPTGRWFVWDMPDPRVDYVFFCDPSYGVGSANATICVMNANKRSLVAEFVDPNTPTYDLALEVAVASRKGWRGSSNPLVGWETNGPGASMHHDFERAKVRRLYRQRQEAMKGEHRTDRLGWTSNSRTKRSMLGDLGRALAQEEVLVYSAACLDEMLEYVVIDGRVEAGSRRDLTTGAREAHGDRVISLAGALMLCEEIGEQPDDGSEFPQNSLGAILKHDEVLKSSRQ